MEPDPVLDYARPDVAGLFWATIQPLGGGYSWCYAATETDLFGWRTTVYMQVEARAGRWGQAFRLADQQRRALCALPWTDWDQGVIARVDNTDGPFMQADDDGSPRYIARYAVVVHPRPAI